MAQLKSFAITLLISLVWCNYTFAMPKCKGDIVVKWTDCIGAYTINDGSKKPFEFKIQDMETMHDLSYEEIKNFQYGTKYIGEFKNGEPHGKGIRIRKAGGIWSKKMTVLFEEGEFKQGRLTEKGIFDKVDIILERNLPWKIKDKYIKPECMWDNQLRVWSSLDNYEMFYEKYLGKKNFDPMKDKDFQKFINNIGLYLNKEVPLNDGFDPGWFNTKYLSLSLNLKDCLNDLPVSEIVKDGEKMFYHVNGFEKDTEKKWAPHIDQKFLSVAKIEANWGSDSYLAYFGILKIDEELIMVPLKNILF